MSRGELDALVFMTHNEFYLPAMGSHLSGTCALAPSRFVRAILKVRGQKTVMLYHHGRQSLERSAIDFIVYDEEYNSV